MSIVLQGSTSGSITLQEPAIAGSNTINLPAATGTMALLQTPSFATTIGVGGATPSTSGAGITFPSSQSASTDANTLDDYEEGTWTPIQGAGITVSGSFSSSGTYTKIGNLVRVTGLMSATISISAGNAGVMITNLPFSASQDAGGTVFNANLGSPSIIDAIGSLVYATNAVTASTGIFFNVTYRTST